MENYKYFLNEGKSAISNELLLSFLMTKNIPLLKSKPKKDEGYLLSKNGKIYTVYTNDRIAFREHLHNFLNVNKIKFTERTMSSSVPVTEFDGYRVVFKPLGVGGSGAGSSQTEIQEVSQALVISLSFNVLKRKIKESDLILDNLQNAYQFVDKNDIEVTKLLDFILSSKDWTNTFISTNNSLFKDYYVSSKKYTLHRGSTFVNKLYADYRTLSKEMGIKAKDDKWNPADIWLISDSVKNYNNVSTLTELNSMLEKQFNDKNIIGISLKKLKGEPKVQINNLSTDTKLLKYKDYILSDKSKDLYLEDTNGNRVQFRSFNFMGGYQGEIKGKVASHGKAGYSIINYYLEKFGNAYIYDTQITVKNKIERDSNSLYIDFVELWNTFFANKISNKEDVLELAKTNSNSPNDWIFSKFISMQLLKSVNEMTQDSKDKFITNIVGYAKSESSFSSVFVKVY